MEQTKTTAQGAAQAEGESVDDSTQLVERERRMRFALQRAATAWCDPETEHKVMDVELAEAFARRLVEDMYAPHLGCATTGDLLAELRTRAEIDGKLDYRSIDKE